MVQKQTTLTRVPGPEFLNKEHLQSGLYVTGLPNSQYGADNSRGRYAGWFSMGRRPERWAMLSELLASSLQVSFLEQLCLFSRIWKMAGQSDFTNLPHLDFRAGQNKGGIAL